MSRRRAAGIVAATSLAVVALLLAAVLLTIRSGTRATIVLPDTPPPAAPETPDPPPEVLFVEVGRDNIQKILAGMERPEAYHQIVTVSTLWSGGTSDKTVEIYRSGPLVLAGISDGARSRSLLTDGETVWIWYEGEREARALAPDPSIGFDDLLGIPTYETVASIEPDAVADAGFVTLDDSGCLYVSSADGIYEDRYWIDTDTRLLCRADGLEDGQLTYQLRQTFQEVLTAGDAALRDRFRLPDGTKVGEG